MKFAALKLNPPIPTDILILHLQAPYDVNKEENCKYVAINKLPIMPILATLYVCENPNGL